MKKLSLVGAVVEKASSRNERRNRAECVRTRALRLEGLESRELLSVAPGGDLIAPNAAFVAYESNVSTNADDVLDLSGAMLDAANSPAQLAAPTVSTRGIASDALFVSWGADPNATGYVVAYKEDWADSFVEIEVDASESSLVIEELDSETDYEVKVQALGDDDSWMSSSYSATITVATQDSSFPSLYDYEDLRDCYDELTLPESMADVNIIIPQDWTAQAIIDAVAEANSTPLSDVILLDADQYDGEVLDLSGVTITLDADYDTSGAISFLSYGMERPLIKANASDVTFHVTYGLAQFGGFDFIDVDPEVSAYRVTTTTTYDGFDTAGIGIQDVDMYDVNGISVEGASHNAVPEPPSVSATPRANDYALLFIGGGNRNLNKERYHSTLADYYCELVEEFSFDPTKIYILYADGNMNGTSRNLYVGNGFDKSEKCYVASDMSFVLPGTTVRAANGSNLTSTLAEIAGNMTAETHLFAWVWDHGSGEGYASNKESCYDEEFITGWQDAIAATTVRDAFFQIPQGYVTCVFSQCYSGGILDDIFDPATGKLRSVANGYADGYSGSAHFAGAAASNHYEPSWSDFTVNGYIGYAQTFKEALRQASTGTAVFEYAEQHDPFSARRRPETYAANEGYFIYNGIYNWEHPWHAGETFSIFSEPSVEQSAPTFVSHTETQNSVALTWSEVQDASSYTLEYVAVGAVDSVVVESITSTSYEVSGLVPSTNYEFRVKADNSPYSEWISASTSAVEPTPLATPVLTVGEKTDSTITVSWDAVPNAERYTLSYKLAGATVWTDKSVGTATNFTITGLVQNSDYEVRLQAIGDGVNYASVYSATVNAKTEATPVVPVGPVTLTKPVLTQDAATGSTITVSWNAVENAERYSLSYKPANSTTWTNKNVGTDTSFTMTGLELSTSYDVRVKAIGDGENYKSVYSAIFSAQTTSTPDQPVGPVTLAKPVLTVDSATGSTITVSWNAVPNVERYSFSYKPANSTTWTNKNVGTDTSFTMTGLELSTSYDVRVKAIGDGENYKSVYSAIFSAQTTSTPDKPVGPVPLAKPVLTVANATGSTLTISWNAVPNAERYSFSYRPANSTTWTAKNVGTATSYTITGLDLNTNYDVQLKAIGDGENYKSVYSAILGAQTTSTPDQPVGPVTLAKPVLTVSGVTGTTVTVSWNAVENAERYSLSYKLANSTTWTNKNVGTETSYTITGLELNTSYDVRLKAIGDGVSYKSVYSSVVGAQTDSTSSAVFELGDEFFDELEEEDFDLLARDVWFD